MKWNEKIKRYRKEAGLSQEALAAKIFVSRTLITKYESGSVFPTEENLKKLAKALNIDVQDLLDDEEKHEVAERSYKNAYRLFLGLSIAFASFSAIFLLLSIIPFYAYSSYDYSSVTSENPTLVHVTGYVSIIGATCRGHNPIGIIGIVFYLVCLVVSLLSSLNLSKRVTLIFRVASMILFVISLVLFIWSFASMASIVSAPGFQMNTRTE